MSIRQALAALTVSGALVFSSSLALAAEAATVADQFRNNVTEQRVILGAGAGQAAGGQQQQGGAAGGGGGAAGAGAAGAAAGGLGMAAAIGLIAVAAAI